MTLRTKERQVFRTKTRDEWCAIMEGSDVCFAPVLSILEAPNHPHNKARGTFVEVDGITQPVPSPRLSRTPAKIQGSSKVAGADSRALLGDFGHSDAEIAALLERQIIFEASQ